MCRYEPLIRLGCFVGVMFALVLWEVAAPRRALVASKPTRWFSNLALLALNTIAIRLAFALGAVGVAVEAQRQQWGVFNNLAGPTWLELILSVVLLDLAIYLQHVLFHAVPALWRLHMVHHADPDLDVTTGLRFHTLEIALSMAIKVAVIVVLGPSPLAVVIFEVLLNATSMFSHSNIKMPRQLDAVLRFVVVTPDMHRIHHSTIQRETNSNFGFNLPWWDYLLGTYRAQPAQGHQSMLIGLLQIPPRRAIRLPSILLMPFANPTGDTPINERTD